MRNLFKIILAFLIIANALVSCTDKEEVNPSFIKLNNEQFEIAWGEIYDAGTNTEITFRTYYITLLSTNSETPAHYIELWINSSSTSRLEEGTYSYDYYGYDIGLCNYIETGIDIKYDDTGNAVEGTRLMDEDVKSGEIIISKANGNYSFDISIIYEHNGIEKKVEAFFNDVLHEY